MFHPTGLPHPEWEAEGSVVRLEAHWSPLLQDGLMSCMQPLTDRRGWIIVVVMTTLGRVVVIVVVCRLIGFVVFLLTKEVGMKVSANKSGLLKHNIYKM